VLDTTVLVAALRSDAGASRKLVMAALDRRLVLLLSVPLMIEYEAVLSRPEHLHASGDRLARRGSETMGDVR
jgi:predicted nucleic acid-binding protein